MKVKAKLKECSIYPHGEGDKRYNVEIEVDLIEWQAYGEDITHICGMGDDFETYHCWRSEDVEITEVDLT